MPKLESHCWKGCIALFFFCHFALPVIAQTGVWNNLKNKTGQAEKTFTGTKNKIKGFQDHLKKWGLDSNYTRGIAIGGRLNTNGWSGLISYQRRINKLSSHLLTLSLSEIKHEKQVKQQKDNTSYPELGASSPFVFGKINNLYALQIGYGREYLLLPSILEDNLSVSLHIQGGISLAMLKPYYLKLIYTDFTPVQHSHLREESYHAGNTEKFLTSSNVLGASKWSKGLKEISYVPGAYIDASVALVSSKQRIFVKTITLGASFGFYTQRLPIMADNNAYPWLGCLFVGLRVGKYWE